MHTASQGSQKKPRLSLWSADSLAVAQLDYVGYFMHAVLQPVRALVSSRLLHDQGSWLIRHIQEVKQYGMDTAWLERVQASRQADRIGMGSFQTVTIADLEVRA